MTRIIRACVLVLPLLCAFAITVSCTTLTEAILNALGPRNLNDKEFDLPVFACDMKQKDSGCVSESQCVLGGGMRVLLSFSLKHC